MTTHVYTIVQSMHTTIQSMPLWSEQDTINSGVKSLRISTSSLKENQLLLMHMSQSISESNSWFIFYRK